MLAQPQHIHEVPTNNDTHLYVIELSRLETIFKSISDASSDTHVTQLANLGWALAQDWANDADTVSERV